MVLLLAYRMQEREHGGLSQSAPWRLRELAKGYDAKGRSGPGDSPFHAGTRLVRSWKGELHEVPIADQGFDYRVAASKHCPVSRERSRARAGRVQPSSVCDRRSVDDGFPGSLRCVHPQVL